MLRLPSRVLQCLGAGGRPYHCCCSPLVTTLATPAPAAPATEVIVLPGAS
jgi:hypothetical protein